MNEQIKAGADIHAGDGGYSESTKEKYDEFVKLRNQSMNESMNGKLKVLMLEAGYAFPEGATRAHKLSELIIQECISAIESTDRHRSDYFIAKIKEHFGVEE